MSDQGGDADFTLRLLNDVSGPARAAKKSLSDLSAGFKKLGFDADASWKKQMAAAKAGMAKEHGAAGQLGLKQQLAMAKQIAKEKQNAEAIAGKQAARNANIQSRIDLQKKKHDDHFFQAQADQHGSMLEGLADTVATDGLYAIGAAAAAAAAAVAYIGYEFIKNTEAALEFKQASVNAIGYLTDSAPQAAGVFDDVRHEAQALGLDVKDTEGSFQKLLAAQFSVGQSKQLIKMGADLQAIGADAEHVQRLFYAISEIKNIGTLQKRQERMLMMAGISGKLIDEALMKRMNIKTHGGLDLARKKNKIGADVAIEAIKDAVMAKTHEKELGEAGKATADSTIKGMRAQLAAGVDNWFIDIGDRIDAVTTGIVQHAKHLVIKVASDSGLNKLGEKLLNKSEYVGLWVDANWPKIESLVVGGLHQVYKAFDTGLDVLQFFEDHTASVKLALEGAAVALGAVAVAGLTISLPLLVGAAAVGAITAGLMMLEGYVVNSIKEWMHDGNTLGANLVQGILDGMFDGIPSLISSSVNLARTVIGTLRTEMKTHSPSELTYDMGYIGIGGGLAGGMDDSQAMVKSSAVSLSGGTIEAVGHGMAGGGGGSGGTPAVHLHVTCEGGATQEDGERFGAGIMSKIDARVFALLDSLDIEGAGEPA